MKPYARLIYPSPLPGALGDQELRTGPADRPHSLRQPTPEDIAAALAYVTDDWFFFFLVQFRKRDPGRAFSVAAFLNETKGVESDPPDLGDFGYDPEDSKRLLELRSAIDDGLGWANDKERERGDYVARVEEVGVYVRALEARFPGPTPAADKVGLAHCILNWLESRNGAELEPALEGMTVGDQRRMREELTLILEHGGRPPNWT